MSVTAGSDRHGVSRAGCGQNIYHVCGCRDREEKRAGRVLVLGQGGKVSAEKAFPLSAKASWPRRI